MEAPLPLILDFLEWLTVRRRTYSEVIEIWRTSCPRLPVLEDAFDLGYARRVYDRDSGALVEVTELGLEILQAERPTSAAPD